MNITINEEAWQYVLDKANSTAETAFNITEAAKPEKERAEFVPKTLETYVQERIDSLNESYAKQIVIDLANDPIVAARIQKILASPKEVRDAFAAQVDAL